MVTICINEDAKVKLEPLGRCLKRDSREDSWRVAARRIVLSYCRLRTSQLLSFPSFNFHIALGGISYFISDSPLVPNTESCTCLKLCRSNNLNAKFIPLFMCFNDDEICLAIDVRSWTRSRHALLQTHCIPQLLIVDHPTFVYPPFKDPCRANAPHSPNVLPRFLSSLHNKSYANTECHVKTRFGSDSCLQAPHLSSLKLKHPTAHHITPLTQPTHNDTRRFRR